jgi:hypothetical protein
MPEASDSRASVAHPTGPTALSAGISGWLAPLIALLCVAMAILQAFSSLRINEQTALFLGLALVAAVINDITKFKGAGIEIEKRVQDLQLRVRQMDTAVVTLEKEVGPGASKAAATSAQPLGQPATAENAAADPADPNHLEFGGQAERNGRRLSATIEPIAGPQSASCRVRFVVQATAGADPLTGMVRVHLHPTFGRWSRYDLEVMGGVARDEFVAYGAFTIGVEADGGRTRLELNLADVSGGTDAFYRA